MLSTSPPSVAASFTAAARHRYTHGRGKGAISSPPLFATTSSNIPEPYAPTPELHDLLAYARSLLGAGMGFASIAVLCTAVRATSGLRWDEEGAMADALAIIDADLSQAIQSCKEELAGDNVRDIHAARAALNDLRAALDDCYADVTSWGGEFPFERGAANADCLEF